MADPTRALGSQREVEFYEAIERCVAASRDRLELNDPSRATVLLVAALAMVESFFLRTRRESSLSRDEFLQICGFAFDKAKGGESP